MGSVSLFGIIYHRETMGTQQRSCTKNAVISQTYHFEIFAHTHDKLDKLKVFTSQQATTKLMSSAI